MKKYVVDVEVKTGKSKANLDKTNKQVKNLDNNVKSVAKSSTNLNDSFAVMPGSIGRVVQSFKALKQYIFVKNNFPKSISMASD